jgi:hypothetical protein
VHARGEPVSVAARGGVQVASLAPFAGRVRCIHGKWEGEGGGRGVRKSAPSKENRKSVKSSELRKPLRTLTVAGARRAEPVVWVLVRGVGLQDAPRRAWHQLGHTLGEG